MVVVAGVVVVVGATFGANVVVVTAWHPAAMATEVELSANIGLYIVTVYVYVHLNFGFFNDRW